MAKLLISSSLQDNNCVTVMNYIIIIRLFRIGPQEQVCTTRFLVHGDSLMITMVAVSGRVLCGVCTECTEKLSSENGCVLREVCAESKENIDREEYLS